MTDWQPTADLALLHARAHMLSHIRSFFTQRNVLEVETPLVSQYGVSDPHIDSLSVNYLASEGAGVANAASTADEINSKHFLMSSPEYAMKRLLAAGSGSIYQVAKAFRNGEVGRRHNPEFTLLEWYRVDYSLTQIMQEVAELITLLLSDKAPPNQPFSQFKQTSQLNQNQPTWQYLTYTQAFESSLGFNPFLYTDAQLAAKAQSLIDIDLDADTPRDTWLDLLMSHKVEPALPAACMVYDYPASQAALAQIETNAAGHPVAKRFEVYINGVELANGYQELTDAKEQQARFGADNAMRRKLGKSPMPADTRLIAALSSGLPACSGVALGLDRLLMLNHGKKTIAEVLAFGFARA